MEAKRDILIVDDHPVVRRGLRQLIDQAADMRTCGEAGSAGEAQQSIEALNPDLVLLDLALGGTNGIEFVKQLQHTHPDLPVLVVSMYDEALYAERVFGAGARGYIMKRAPDEELLAAIRRVFEGQRYASEDLREKLFTATPGAAQAVETAPVDRLSDRELEVFQLIGQGYAPRHIADALHMSVKTVESHRQHLKQKLNVGSANELRRFAIQWAKDRGQR